MRSNKAILSWALAALLLAASPAFTQGNGRGRGHNKGGDAVASDTGDHGENFGYSRDDQAKIHTWYAHQENNLPPGLTKKDRLPPGLEKQLVVRGQLPPGLQKKIQPAPVELVRQLPPPPPDCAHVIIGGHLVLLNRKTDVVVDIFHFEL